MKVYYNPNLKDKAKKLRKNSTLSEVLLWNLLKNKQLLGYRFHRQKPINEFIVDFYCPQLRLIIEIDGSSHDYKEKQDNIRAMRLKSLGFRILRYEDKDVRADPENVAESIKAWIISNS